MLIDFLYKVVLMIDSISQILGVHRNSYFNYKKQARPIIFLLEKYFTKEDLQEFLETGKIKKMDYVNSYLNNLRNKCNKIYGKIEKMEIEYKNHNVNYESNSMFFTQNLYRSYLSPFLLKHEDVIKNFKVENFKADFIALALNDPFEFKKNGIPEPLVTFQILSILDELSSAEMHYFFNEYDKNVHDIE